MREEVFRDEGLKDGYLDPGVTNSDGDSVSTLLGRDDSSTNTRGFLCPEVFVLVLPTKSS